ncbi:hypothetical protein vBSenI1_168 [Salmonella phage vB_Sen_I1]|uniref:Uncharacterized protein n=1 Tax=Salmonella phage vB_Sen_I1 TaxID=2723910 RepID=A0A7L5CHB5_9CAUD|nr:hypothetical protein vBSenI1_168 [Salmonella phage vB_Sen_I1]
MSCFNGFESQRGVTAWCDRDIILLLEEQIELATKTAWKAADW